MVAASTVLLNGVDHYRVMEPLFECVRVLLSYRGEAYSPAYIQGISGAAFRIGGICPCAPTCTSAMGTQDLVKLLGYEMEYLPLCGEGIDPETRVYDVLARVKEELRAGRPVILWNAFTTCEWDVVCGFDEEKKQLVGRGSYQGLEEYARAEEKRAIKCADICPELGAILVHEKTGRLEGREAELSALREAVHHASIRKDDELLKSEKWVFLEGLQCYDRWISDFSKPDTKRGSGDSYCLGVYRSTHRAASQFMLELAPKFPEASASLKAATASFAVEADALDESVPLLGWGSPQGPDPQRNERAVPLLSRARGGYAGGIEEIRNALEIIS